VERFWFPGVMAGKPDVAGRLQEGAEAHWHVRRTMSAEEIFSDYPAAIGRANAVLPTAAERPYALKPVPGSSSRGTVSTHEISNPAVAFGLSCPAAGCEVRT
jgi:hypothetical protein